MKLVYKATGLPVALGDTVILLGSGEEARVAHFKPPHKPSSQGHVTVDFPLHKRRRANATREYYVSIIGAEWIDREDREPEWKRLGYSSELQMQEHAEERDAQGKAP